LVCIINFLPIIFVDTLVFVIFCLFLFLYCYNFLVISFFFPLFLQAFSNFPSHCCTCYHCLLHHH
jgi:hypothetical protein